MAIQQLNRVSDNWWGLGNAAINSAVTSLVLSSSGSAGLTVPCLINEGAEKLLVTAIDVDTPTSGLDTLTIERGYGGTTPASHLSGAKYRQLYYKEHHNDLSRQLEACKMILASMLGRSNGVSRGPSSTELEATAQGSPDMTVNVAIGAALIDDEVAGIVTASTLTLMSS